MELQQERIIANLGKQLPVERTEIFKTVMELNTGPHIVEISKVEGKEWKATIDSDDIVIGEQLSFTRDIKSPENGAKLLITAFDINSNDILILEIPLSQGLKMLNAYKNNYELFLKNLSIIRKNLCLRLPIIQKFETAKNI